MKNDAYLAACKHFRARKRSMGLEKARLYAGATIQAIKAAQNCTEGEIAAIEMAYRDVLVNVEEG